MVHLENRGPEIPAFYRGRSVFITGGTGFMGKVLLERLLTTCPEVSRLYVLMREKKGVSPEARLQELKDSQAFDALRLKNPRLLDKIEMVAGDVTKPQLGLTDEAALLLRDVSVVFHNAATVKMEGPLKQAVETNLVSVMVMLELCDSLPHVEAFVHVSTAYTNAELSTVEEKVYPPPMELSALLALVEGNDFDEHDSKRFLGRKPNTYTFTKAMAEDVVKSHGCEKYAVGILRPSIVVSSQTHPYPGWIENLNGPSGVIAGVSVGALHIFQADVEKQAALIPCDMVIDSLIAVAWEIAVDRPSEVRVYNCTSIDNPLTWDTFQTVVNRAAPEYCSNRVILYPHLCLIGNEMKYRFLAAIFQSAPLYFLECVMRLLRINNPRQNLIKMDGRFKSMCEVLKYFSVREWDFKNGNMVRLRARLCERDRALFNMDPNTIDWEMLLTDFVKGTRKYILKEQDSQLAKARRRVRKLSCIHTLARVFFYITLFKIIQSCWNVFYLFK